MMNPFGQASFNQFYSDAVGSNATFQTRNVIPTGMPFPGKMVPKKPAAQPMHCEVCNCDCSSEQTFTEHLNGQKHRKKLAQIEALQQLKQPQRQQLQHLAQSGSNNEQKLDKEQPVTAAQQISTLAADSLKNKSLATTVFCDICSVSCSGIMAFNSHISGAKHQKAVQKQSQAKQEVQPLITKTAVRNSGEEFTQENDVLYGEEEVMPLLNEAGVTVGFHCKLCDCTTTDSNGRLSHLKGRKHRLAYKSKYDPSLVIEERPSDRARNERLREMRNMRRTGREDHWNMIESMFASQTFGYGRPGPEKRYRVPWQPFSTSPMYQKPTPSMHNSRLDDKYVFMKRDDVVASPSDLEIINAIVSACEKALKQVSDIMTNEEKEERKLAKSAEEQNVVQDKGVGTEGEGKAVDDEESRMIKGVLWVGCLATGCILKEDKQVELVLLTKDKPTWELLEKLATKFTEQLPSVTSPDIEYSVEASYDDACIRVMRVTEPQVVCIITVTSPMMRRLVDDEVAEDTPDPENMLPKDKCLEALARLRHVKWFQMRCARLNQCSSVLPVLRDLCRRDSRWSVLSDWAQELLVEKCICYAGYRSSSDVLRTVFECVASGLFLTEGSGLYDPCEKDPTDLVGHLTEQQREDITLAAQTAVRQLVFRQMHKILDVAELPKLPNTRNGKVTKQKRSITSESKEEASPTTEKRPKDEFTENVEPDVNDEQAATE